MSEYKILRVNGCLEILDKKPTLIDMQKILGGYIEPIIIGRNTLWIDKHGEIKGLPTNKLVACLINKIIVGDVIFEIQDPYRKDV